MTTRSVADILGPWIETEFDSGLIQRCCLSWNTPINDLSNEILATFLRQKIATVAVLDVATRRLEAGFDDGSELYEGELANAVEECRRGL
jgi:hypothetical protein